MFGQTNADTMAVQKESMAGAGGKKGFVPFKKKGFGGKPFAAAKVPRAFGTDPDSDGDGLSFAKIMRRGK